MEDVVGIVMALGSGEPFRVATIAFRDTVHVAFGEEVRIRAGKRNRIEGLKSGTRPLAMRLLLTPVGPEQSEDLDEHMVAAQAKSRRRRGYSRRAPLNSWVKMAQPGETPVSIVWMKTSMLALSSAGSQHVSMKTRWPLKIYGSNKVNEAP
jgi:hypothetical protein